MTNEDFVSSKLYSPAVLTVYNCLDINLLGYQDEAAIKYLKSFSLTFAFFFPEIVFTAHPNKHKLDVK